MNLEIMSSVVSEGKMSIGEPDGKREWWKGGKGGKGASG
jgi:hypothetical protein